MDSSAKKWFHHLKSGFISFGLAPFPGDLGVFHRDLLQWIRLSSAFAALFGAVLWDGKGGIRIKWFLIGFLWAIGGNLLKLVLLKWMSHAVAIFFKTS